MNRIILLDDNTISKIAAGEVIERPASVVKELVENSLDAGAKSVSIEIKNGGKDLIAVSDDGSGMSSDDAQLAVDRHSTSKIKSAEDLFSIRTLGFRGEALASIAAVSKFELTTNSDEASSGLKVSLNGGKNKRTSRVGRPKGTTVTVEELFFNTPARLKFQKSRTTELSHIIEIISKFILSNPSVSFKLKSDGEEALDSTGSGKLIDAIASVYGVDMAKAMLEVGGEARVTGDLKINGYVSQPVITKSDRNGESIFVNGRFVRNALISRALEDSYRSLIPHGKYPIAVLLINIDPAEIDVNVHPTKREVKFARPDIAMRAVTDAVSKALSGVGVEKYEVSPQVTNWQISRNESMPDMLRIEETSPHLHPLSYSIGEGCTEPGEGRGEVFQHLLTYIICMDGEDLLMIDQHAAHERILYEKIRSGKTSDVQSLLVPQTIELEAKDFALISGNLGELKELGFELEVFGKNTVMVRGVPAVLMARNVDQALKEMIWELSQSFKIKSVDERKDAIFKMMACKAAVKAGDKLSMIEMQDLVRQLKASSNPTTCPHGRPTMMKMSRADFERAFQR